MYLQFSFLFHFGRHCRTPPVIWKSAEKITFSNLKPSLKTISLRLPETMMETLKIMARKQDIPYQSLFFLQPAVKHEYNKMDFVN
jgi:predicted DNA binding CopG/RHH family protein